MYLVITGFDNSIENVLGPYKEERHAQIASQTIKKMPYPKAPSRSTYGDGDTWVRIEEREYIQ